MLAEFNVSWLSMPLGSKAWERERRGGGSWSGAMEVSSCDGGPTPLGHGDLLSWVASTVDQVFIRSSSHWLWVVPGREDNLEWSWCDFRKVKPDWRLCSGSSLNRWAQWAPLWKRIWVVSPCLFHKFPGSSMCNGKQTNKQKTLETT